MNGLNDWNNGSGLRLFNVLGKTKAVGDAERFNLNVAMTNNVLAAARLAGVKKIVCGSSLAIYGLYYPVTVLQPDYLPVDEDHPLRPQDPYGLSKLVGEKLCDAASLKDGLPIASLRFSGIYTEEHRELLIEHSRNRGAVELYRCARCRACLPPRARSGFRRPSDI